MKTPFVHLLLLACTLLLFVGCRGCLSPHRINRVEIVSVEPEWLNEIGPTKSYACHDFIRTHLRKRADLPDAISLKLHVRFFSDLSDSADQYHKVYGVHGLLDTLVGIRIGIASPLGTTTWMGQTDWEANRFDCGDVPSDIALRNKETQFETVYFEAQRSHEGYQDLRSLMVDINQFNHMPYTTFPEDKQAGIRIFLFPRPADSVPSEGRLVVELEFTSGRCLRGRENPI